MSLVILHIETASPICSVCIAKDGVLAAEAISAKPVSHATQLAPLIKEVFMQADQTAAMLDAIAVSTGPGSYTGLRIGLSTAKGLAYANDLPLIGLSSMDCLAQSITQKPVLTIMDSRKNELYAGLYGAGSKDFAPKPVVLDDAWFSSLPEKPFYLCGTGIEKFTNAYTKGKNYIIEKKLNYFARNMVLKAIEVYKKKMFLDVAYAKPNYLKPFFSNPNVNTNL